MGQHQHKSCHHRGSIEAPQSKLVSLIQVLAIGVPMKPDIVPVLAGEHHATELQ